MGQASHSSSSAPSILEPVMDVSASKLSGMGRSAGHPLERAARKCPLALASLLWYFLADESAQDA